MNLKYTKTMAKTWLNASCMHRVWQEVSFRMRLANLLKNKLQDPSTLGEVPEMPGENNDLCVTLQVSCC